MSSFITLSSNSPQTVLYGCFCDENGNIERYRQIVNNEACDLTSNGGMMLLSKPTDNDKKQVVCTPNLEEVGFIENISQRIAQITLSKFSPPLVLFVQVDEKQFLSEASSSQIFKVFEIFDSTYSTSYLKDKKRDSVVYFALDIKVLATPPLCSPSSPYVYGTKLFPTFFSLEELKNSCWFNYINFVYNVDTIEDRFPIETSKFFFFYENLLPNSVKEVVVPTIKTNPCQYGDFFRSINAAFNICNSLWAYQYPIAFLPENACLNKEGAPQVPFPYENGIASNKWVEVTHCCCDFDDNGYFFYVAVGSGIWYNVGNTIVFPDHIDAYCFFYKVDKSVLSEYDVECLNGDGSLSNTLDAKNARAAKENGYDSIQFNYRWEKNDFTGEAQYKYEIQDCRFIGSQDNNQCFPDILKPFIRAGWWKTELEGQPPLECVCETDNPNKPCLNCKNQILGKCPPV